MKEMPTKEMPKMAKTQIIERKHEPFRPLEVDTVTLDIIESALRNALSMMSRVTVSTSKIGRAHV